MCEHWNRYVQGSTNCKRACTFLFPTTCDPDYFRPATPQVRTFFATRDPCDLATLPTLCSIGRGQRLLEYRPRQEAGKHVDVI